MPLVTVITPVYNSAHWLAETLASVRAQTFTDWEHILVDDRSTDDSLSIIHAMSAQDPRVRFLQTDRNSGPSVARNLALEAAAGRYVAFLDADDLWLPDKLKICVDAMVRNEWEFIYHDYRHMSQDGARVGALISGPNELNMRTLHTRRGAGCLSVMLDRERLDWFRFPASERYQHEDFCGWLSLVKRGYFGYRVPFDLGRYRLLETSRSANRLKGAKYSWRIYREVSNLSLPRAAVWWLQYAWNTFWMHRLARPR